MSKIEVSPVNNEKRSESSGGNYDIWRKTMDKVHGDAGVKPPTINRPYIRKETVNTVAERDSDDSIRMEEMPAGKSKEQIEREKAGRIKIDNEMQARMEAYWAEKRASEQKQREEQERVQDERAEAEAERQRILLEQRERVKNSYRQNIENISEEEQEDEMEMGM